MRVCGGMRLCQHRIGRQGDREVGGYSDTAIQEYRDRLGLGIPSSIEFKVNVEIRFGHAHLQTGRSDASAR